MLAHFFSTLKAYLLTFRNISTTFFITYASFFITFQLILLVIILI